MACKLHAQYSCVSYPNCAGCNAYLSPYPTKAFEQVVHMAVAAGKAAKAMSVSSAATIEYLKKLESLGENKMSNVNWKVENMDYICDTDGVQFKAQLTGRPGDDIWTGRPADILHDLEVRVGEKPSRIDGIDAYKYITRDIKAVADVKEKIDEWKNRPRIEKVVFNPPATIVFWKDGTKTVVKVQNNEDFDPEKGLAMAITKKTFGNAGSYFDVIKEWTDTYERVMEES